MKNYLHPRNTALRPQPRRLPQEMVACCPNDPISITSSFLPDRDYLELLTDMLEAALLCGDADEVRLCQRALARVGGRKRQRNFDEIEDWQSTSASDALTWLEKEAAFVSYGHPNPGDMAWIARSVEAPLPVRMWLSPPG